MFWERWMELCTVVFPIWSPPDPKANHFLCHFSHLRALLKIMFLSMHPSYDHSYKLYLYIYICIHIFTYAIIYYFPSPQYIPWRFIILTRRLDSSLAWELWVWRCYRFLVAIFIPRWVSLEKNLMTCWCFFWGWQWKIWWFFLAKKHLVLVKL